MGTALRSWCSLRNTIVESSSKTESLGMAKSVGTRNNISFELKTCMQNFPPTQQTKLMSSLRVPGSCRNKRSCASLSYCFSRTDDRKYKYQTFLKLCYGYRSRWYRKMDQTPKNAPRYIQDFTAPTAHRNTAQHQSARRPSTPCRPS